MKKQQITLFFLIIFTNSLYAQDQQAFNLIKLNNIKSIESIISTADQRYDSTLISDEYYNRQGRRTKIQLYQSSAVTSSYEYLFEHDTINIERRTYEKGKLVSVTKIYYDKWGNPITNLEFDGNNKAKGISSELKYNKQRQLIETEVYIESQLVSHRKYKYYENGQKKEVQILKPKGRAETIKFDINGSQLKPDRARIMMTEEHFENHNGANTKMSKKTLTYGQNTITIGLAGPLELKQNDVLVTEKYYKTNGLLDYEHQYLNGKFITEKKYRYLTYE